MSPKTRRRRRLLRTSRCQNCGSTSQLTIDHIRPKSLGYQLKGNRQVLCWTCNQNKGALTIDYRTRTLELESWMFSLNDKGLRELFSNTNSFCCSVYNPNFKNISKYFK